MAHVMKHFLVHAMEHVMVEHSTEQSMEHLREHSTEYSMGCTVVQATAHGQLGGTAIALSKETRLVVEIQQQHLDLSIVGTRMFDQTCDRMFNF